MKHIFSKTKAIATGSFNLNTNHETTSTAQNQWRGGTRKKINRRNEQKNTNGSICTCINTQIVIVKYKL